MVETMPPLADSHFWRTSVLYSRPTGNHCRFGTGWASRCSLSGSVTKKPVSVMPSGSSSFSFSISKQ